MPLCIYQLGNEGKSQFGFVAEDAVIDVAAAGGPASLGAALELSKQDLEAAMARVQQSDQRIPLADVTLKAPIDWQEVWCAGVTYKRSRDARMEESQ